jgi:pimeloyl-ACP methyl ester carboxylesterase
MRGHTMLRTSLFAGTAAAFFLAACGGSNDDVPRGSLIETPTTVSTLTVAQINASTAASGLQAISGPAKCDVRVVALNYNTIGVNGERTNASAALLQPVGACASAAAPLLTYAKGTDVQKPRTLANPSDSETFSLIAMFAAQGYAVVATDYLGFAKSGYSFHPYLHGDSEASAVIDALRAARYASATVGLALSGKVMFYGYSQGGHSSAFAQKNAERDNAAEFNIVAGAHGAGPYNLSGSFKSPVVIAGYQFFVPYLVNAYQKVYGDIWTDITTVYKTPYSSYIFDLLPSPTLTYTTLVTTAPAGSTTPYLPGAAGETPAQARDKVFQSAFITDVQTNSSNHLYLDAKKNDLIGWSPKAKTLLCGGAGDPTVPPALHRDVFYADLQARGVTTVSITDVDPQIRAVYGPPPSDPTSLAFATYYGNYHGAFEPPFCDAAARALFDTVK